MTQSLILVAALTVCAPCAAQDADVDQLIAQTNPAIQAQIETAANAFLGPDQTEPRTNLEGVRELKKLKELTDKEEKIIEQLAIYAVAETREENQQDLKAGLILGLLDLKPSLVIRVLAPYSNADNQQLREFAEMWFNSHDNADAAPRSPPFKSVNYEDYFEYVRRQLGRGEEIPAGFVRYLYERSPGRALLVFAYASGAPDMVARLKLMRDVFEARQQGKVPEPQPELVRQLEERRKVRSRAVRQIELAEHIVSNAIWLDKHGYIVRFQKALPEAKEALAMLAEGEWWARLYVVYVMRQNPKLRQADIIQQLADDENELVSKAAKSEKE